MAKEAFEIFDPEDLVIIGLDTEDRSTRDHPLFDERVFLEMEAPFVRNIMVYGVQIPVIVRQEAGKHYVVDGRQRVRAAREANKTFSAAGEQTLRVPCRLSQGDDMRVTGIMVSTNEHRKDDAILVKARKAAHMLDLGATMDEISIAFGRSTKTIDNWLILVKADPRVHAAVLTGEVSTAAAVEIARRPRAEQRDLLSGSIRTAAESPAGTVSEAVARAGRQKASKAAGAAAREQKGIKRLWLRRALKTRTAESLTVDQRAVLEWFTEGATKKGTWFDAFQWEARAEMEGKPATPPTPKSKKSRAAVVEEPLPPEMAASPSGEVSTADDEDLTVEEIAKVNAGLVRAPKLPKASSNAGQGPLGARGADHLSQILEDSPANAEASEDWAEDEDEDDASTL